MRRPSLLLSSRGNPLLADILETGPVWIIDANASCPPTDPDRPGTACPTGPTRLGRVRYVMEIECLIAGFIAGFIALLIAGFIMELTSVLR